jgi:GTP diphosphokinase / guanosine-3',5'-bis(diphosphate) 3'-diphosphatase
LSSIDELCDRLTSYLTEKQIKDVRRAYTFAEQAHEGQYRKSGEPYVTHPLAATNILADMHMDHHCLMACLLHDVIEDTPATKSVLAKKFGAAVANLVDGVSKLNKMESSGDTHEEQQAENFLKMTLAMSKDIRVIIVKLADRLHNMRTLGALEPQKRRRIAKETLEIYAPIAQRLGINDMRLEFEDRGFAAYYPMRAERLAVALTNARGRRRDLVLEIQQAIEIRLEHEDFDVQVMGREKHLYSIYKKMRDKHLPFKEIMDVFAFRIVVGTVDECYRVLGVMHNLFKPVTSEFNDYIAIPKANGYQSLHTGLVGMHGVPIEIQIRTKEMDDMANFGIAAHWFYKSQGDSEPVSSRAADWIKGLLQIQQQAGNPLEFIEHVKTDLYPDEIYVFTPKGRIVTLSAGATAVDFAYAVHTDIGNRCVGTKINNRLAALSETLQSGQMIEIITAQRAQPHPNWLDFVTTAKARSAIRHDLKHRQQGESLRLGRRLLNKVLSSASISLDEVDEKLIKATIKYYGVASFDELLEQIGLGDRQASSVAKRLVNEDQESQLAMLHSPITIDSSDDHVISFAGCCRPIPGDPIIGHFSSGRGLVIHMDRCKNVAGYRKQPESYTPVGWATDVSGEFQAELWVEVEMFRGIIAELASRISSYEAGIDNISIEERGSSLSVLKLHIRVTDRKHLANIMRRIRLIPAVKHVRRGSNA